MLNGMVLSENNYNYSKANKKEGKHCACPPSRPDGSVFSFRERCAYV